MLAAPPIFLDTAGLLALVNRDDALHERAVRVMTTLAEEGRRAITSDWVLAELLGSTARARLRRGGVRLANELLANRETVVVPATRRTWMSAFDLYRSRPDKEWSLVD